MKTVKIETLKKGDLFQLKNKENSTLYVRGDFNRSEGYNRYQCPAWDKDVQDKDLKTGTLVYVD